MRILFVMGLLILGGCACHDGNVPEHSWPMCGWE